MNDAYRHWAGAYVLGALEPDERTEFEDHLVHCLGCRADVTAFASLPALLSRVDPDDDDLAANDRVASEASRRAAASLQLTRRSVRRWRVAAVAAAAAALVMAGVSVRTDRDDTSSAGIAMTFESSATGSIHTSARPWGTQITLDLTGLPERDRYQLWAVTDAGEFTIAATWKPTPGGVARLSGAAASTTVDLDRIVITSDDERDVILEAPVIS